MGKNVLILTTVSGFLDKFEKDNVKLLQKLGYEVHYAANLNEQHYLFDEKEIERLGVRLHHINIARSPYMLRYNMRAFLQVMKIIRENDISMIHCHTPVGGVIGRMAGVCSMRKHIRVIYTAHGFHFYKGAPLINNSIYYFIEKIMAHYTDVLVVINEEDFQNAQKLHLKKGGTVYKIPGTGLDLERFQPLAEEERRQKREKLGLKADDRFLVSVGELNDNKNHIMVLTALEKLKRANKLEHIRYGICGDGFYWEKIKNLIKKMDLEEHVKMYGYCREVEDILGCADISVFPSKREGMGMAGLEALAMGVPLLAADNRGTREYMRDGKNGYLFRADDVNGLIESIEKIQQLSEKELRAMKNFCRVSVEPFEKKKTDYIMENIYRSMDR